MNKPLINTVSGILFFSYSFFLALPLIHFHPFFNCGKVELHNQKDAEEVFDPFLNSNLECSFSQIFSSTYANYIYTSSYNFNYIEKIKYIEIDFSNKSLQIFQDNNGLRAPPIHS